MFSFLHRWIDSLHKTSIYRQESQLLILCSLVCFFDAQRRAAADFLEEPRIQLKIFFTVLLKNKVTYSLDGLRMSKLTAHFHFWVNCPFNTTLMDRTVIQMSAIFKLDSHFLKETTALVKQISKYANITMTLSLLVRFCMLNIEQMLISEV